MTAPLLTPSDLNYINVRGVPYPPRPELTLIDAEGNLTFTVRGIQFYQKAMQAYGLPHSVKDLKCVADLYALSDKILRIKKQGTSAALQAAFLRGQIDQQQRVSVTQRLFGSIHNWFQADAQQEICVAAGSNVIPGNFGRKKMPHS
ncbi:MAG: hypothetical protein Q7S87_00920 [Agitococcus sp.]|nr:hypothetical protein [Agitococcus sp.]